MGWGQGARQGRVLSSSVQPVGQPGQENRQPCVCVRLSLPCLKGTFNPVASLTLQTLILVLDFSSGHEQGQQEGGWIEGGCQGFASAIGTSSSHGEGHRAAGEDLLSVS